MAEKDFNTVEVKNLPEHVLEEVANESGRLICYKDIVPGCQLTLNYPFYYASIHHTDFSYTEVQPQPQYIVMRRKPHEDVFTVLNFLNNCEHPNILRPSGIWVGVVEKKKNEDTNETTTSEAPVDKDIPKTKLGYIAFPSVDATLSQLPASELFVVENDVSNKTQLSGFSQNGLKAFSDIVSAVKYVNELYNVPGASSSSSSSASARPPAAQWPLQLGKDRIFYQKIATGEYIVQLGDIYTGSRGTIWPRRLARNPSAEELKRANWNALGNYLKALVGDHVPDKELSHLIDTLLARTVTIEDILWEPALWDGKIRIRFIREIVWCIESDKTGNREEQIKKRSSLGLETCITDLGVDFDNESNLLSSVMFLRHKIVAHQDEAYLKYKGPKEEVGLPKANIEKFIRKRKPGYMLKLIEEIRPLKWIGESPLIQSMSNYMQPFGP